ncbi:type VII secretion target [Williamsia maris]|uniref:Excreted virulence factor EspC, type VII ESX diderm n=1 Tax=Williamsia maris TaxID=72806 RepID=A0ABT1H7T4_9NOCA|nr:type VII secretion target [Williamsia maris]MCP2174325.1 Excreted virulence factor EspC, type VII ESX diderm [Williamsia maris]
MNPISVEPTTLTSVAATHATVASDIDSVVSRADLDAIALGVVFGIIGTEFAATAQSATHRYRELVGAMAQGSHRIAHDVGAAGAAYRTTDEDAGTGIAATV